MSRRGTVRCAAGCRIRPLPESARPWLVGLGLVLGYLVLALTLCGPVALHPGQLALGYPTPDAMDTALLRGVVAGGLEDGRSKLLFAPVGYPFAALMPNRLDHLLAAPLLWLLPWPLADNLWWVLALCANGLAGHLLGRRLGGSHGAGVLCGVAFACAEPVLREANLGHAPQALAFAMPLVVLGLGGGYRLLGVSMAIAGLVYWYQPLFLLAICVPFALASPRELPRLGRGALLCLALVALPAALALRGWGGLAMTDAGSLPLLNRPGLEKIPAEGRFLFTQGVDPLAWFLPGPADRSARLPLSLLIAAALGSRQGPRWRWWAAAGLGVLMAMGPFLRWREHPVLFGGEPVPLPGWFLAHASAVLGRLHWPQRWAVVVPLALLPLAARSRWPWLFAAGILAETALFSPHAPLWSAPTGQLDGWRQVEQSWGPVLVWPVQPEGPQQALTGWIQRASGAELARAMHLPPGTPPASDWEAWLAENEVLTGPDPARLRAAGVAAVALDATPGGVFDAAGLAREQARLSALLDASFGPPMDLGSAIVWWIDARPPVEAMPDAAAWRAAWRQRLAEFDRRPVPGGYPVMRWNVPGGRGEGRAGPVLGRER